MSPVYPTTRYFNKIVRQRPSGRTAQVLGTSVYYETYGRGKPLILFHGGLSAIEGLRYQISYFSRYFRVFVPERSGHGRTADCKGAYTYEFLAKQTACWMDQLGLKKARMMGYSDGANLLFWLAAKRTDLVDRFISVGGNYHYKGCVPAFQKALKKQKIVLDSRYASVSPDGAGHYPVVFEKCRRLWLTEPKWPLRMLKKIKVPVLIVAGDQDVICHEHSLAAFRALPKGQLAVIPKASHGLLKEKPALVNPLMLDFLQQKP